ncbi:dUTP diphosphatase [Staphylococcus xylosus]|uniref:dUTP diphosphatase n=1 Tax=Staphylococcus xylosus TaxID=1288 RepID=UPI0035F54315
MTNTITVDQLKELLQIQKDFDDRIPTLNLQDSKVAYVVEFFEWFNTLETFKNWKKNPGKPLDVQLDELADMLAFGLSIANQMDVNIGETEYVNEFLDIWSKNSFHLDKYGHFCSVYDGFGDMLEEDELDNDDALTYLLIPLVFSIQYYSTDKLITAYKSKMEVNHARQDGTADKDKGYI